MAHTRLIPAVVAVCLFAGCAGAPTAPTPGTVTASPTGVWKGVFEISSCSGQGCNLMPQSFVLRLAEDGRGVLQIDTRVYSTAPPMAVDVTAQPGASLVVAGPDNAVPLAARLVLTLAGDTLEGIARYTTDYDGRSSSREGRILFAQRDPTAYAGRFEGNWVGFVARTQCAGDCAQFDPVFVGSGMRWQVSQAGSSLSGTINGNSFTGTADGNRGSASILLVEGPGRCAAGFDDGEICLLDATIVVEKDALDRLTGTITYRVEAVDYRNRPYSFTATVSLAGLARWP